MLQTANPLNVRYWPLTDYGVVWHAMRTFTDARTAETPDELWVVEHPPVFTQGQAGRREHILNPHHIPVVQSDRGGQVTYHGPGQLVLYVLLDLKRRQLGVKTLVCQLEQAIIDVLALWQIKAERKTKAPGVYVQEAKIASVGLRVRRGCSYHGLSFNIDMDLKPFTYINPCGYVDLTITQVKHLKPELGLSQVQALLIPCLTQRLDSVVSANLFASDKDSPCLV